MGYTFEKYQKDIGLEFEKFLSENQDHEAIKFLTDSFYFIGSLSENVSNATKNQEIQSCLDCIFIQTLDLSRSLIHAQSLMLLTPASLSYRTIFEIYCNILFIVRSENHKLMAKRFKDFGTYEELSGRETLKFLENPTKEEVEALLNEYPEWRSKEDVRMLKTPRNWAPENKGIKELALTVGLENEYNVTYKMNSKFSHSSPIITKLYKRQNRLYLVAENKMIVHCTVPGMYYAIQIFIEYCKFFGIDFNQSDYNLLIDSYNTVSRRYTGLKFL